MGGSLPAFFQGIFALLTGVLGISIVGILIGLGILESMRERRLAPVEIAIVGGGAFYSLAWIMSTVLPGGGR